MEGIKKGGNVKNKTVKWEIVFLIMLSVTGCAVMNGQYGSIVLDQAAERNFAAFHIDPQMNYYYSGPDVYPNALMGLKKEYVLDNDLWKALAPDPKIFKEKIRSMQDKARLYGSSQYGFVIRDQQGTPIGVWYSLLTVKIKVVKMGEGNKVIVYTPELDAYDDKHNLVGGDGGHGR
jgi:hypothetical protein